jgi:hypothetical protein
LARNLASFAPKGKIASSAGNQNLLEALWDGSTTLLCTGLLWKPSRSVWFGHSGITIALQRLMANEWVPLRLEKMPGRTAGAFPFLGFLSFKS